MKKYEVEGHVPSYLPEGKNWKLVWSDEFDGTELDETKWNFRRYFWGKKSPTFTDEGVILDGESNMHITLVKKGDDYYSAHLQTGSLTYDIPKDTDDKRMWPFGRYQPAKFMHKFGYYEIRCRLPKNSGWHAAFWLQAPGIGSHPDAKYCGVECDIMENYRQHTEGNLLCGCGYNGYGKDTVWPGHFRVPYVETAYGWHTYAVDWSKEGYIFYADGKEVGRQMPPVTKVSEVEQFIAVTTECHGYHRLFGNEVNSDNIAGDVVKDQVGKPSRLLKQAKLPDEFVVDYVRVFDAVE